MNETQYVCQQDFNEFKEQFIRFETQVEERQKTMVHMLEELRTAKEKGVEHDSTQAALITDLNAQVLSQGQQIAALRESRDTLRDKVSDQGEIISNIQTEKRTLNWVLGIGLSIAIILSPIISELVGQWLTKGG